jgi:ferredoxin-NADP reductase
VRDGGPLLLVGRGSGLVPLMSMLRHRGARASDVEAHVLVSARSEQDALYRDELRGPRAARRAERRLDLHAHPRRGWGGYARPGRRRDARRGRARRPASGR